MSLEDVKMEKVKIEMMDEDWDYDQKNTSDKNLSEKESDTLSDGFIGEENGVKFAMVFGKKVYLDLTKDSDILKKWVEVYIPLINQ